MKLIETENGLSLKFSCQKCKRSLELKAEDRLFECPACSQNYQLKNDNGDVSLKALDSRSVAADAIVDKSSNTKMKISTKPPRVNTGRTSRSRKKKSSASTLIAAFFITFTLLGAGVMYWKSTEQQKPVSQLEKISDEENRSASKEKTETSIPEKASGHADEKIAGDTENTASKAELSVSKESMELSMQEEMQTKVESSTLSLADPCKTRPGRCSTHWRSQIQRFTGQYNCRHNDRVWKRCKNIKSRRQRP